MIRYLADHSLPVFAWCGVLDFEAGTLDLHHGVGVETGSTGAVEGIWNGEFADFDFNRATVFAGTGVVHKRGIVQFCSGTDRLSPIFSTRTTGNLYVSNSPYFLMKVAGLSPRHLYPYYNHDLLSVLRDGLHCLGGEVHLDNGCRMLVHLSAILEVDKAGKVVLRTFPETDSPSDFETYHKLLREETARVLRNGGSSDRQRSLDSIAAISSGYDSCATAALAKFGGCKHALTFYDSKAKNSHADSGAENAASLGMSCTELDRWAYLDSGAMLEAECCLQSVGTGAPIAGTGKRLSNRIYICGTGGDQLWNPSTVGSYRRLSAPWSRTGGSHFSQLEFRLRVGFVQFAPAMIGATHWRSIQRICESDEMKPWSMEGRYNRPVPRRIAESAGIEREGFGLKKRATAYAHLNRAENFSSVSLRSYREFFSKARQESPWRYCFWRNHFFCRDFLYYKMLKHKERHVPSSLFQRQFPYLLNAAPFRTNWEFAMTFQWAFSVVGARYVLAQRKGHRD